MPKFKSQITLNQIANAKFFFFFSNKLKAEDLFASASIFSLKIHVYLYPNPVQRRIKKRMERKSVTWLQVRRLYLGNVSAGVHPHVFHVSEPTSHVTAPG